MLGEQHDIDHEFPKFHEKIVELSDRDPEFAALMKEHDRLDDEIRNLEEHNSPVADTYIEDQQEKAVLIIDKEKAALHGISEGTVTRTVQMALNGSSVDLLHDSSEREDPTERK